MSNMFKQNNRFDSLNGSSAPRYNNERRPRNDGYRQQNTQSFKTLADVAAKEQASKLERNDTNFPSLCATTPSTKKTTTYGDFSQCVKTVIQTETPERPLIDPDLTSLPPGWVLLKYDRKTHTTIVKSKELPIVAPIEKTDDDLAWETMDALASLYENRTNEYIDNWGYEDWERTFRFPNYDYEYFDKLDALYEEELELERAKRQEALELAAENEEYDTREW